MEIRQNDLERGIDVIVDIRREESYDQLKSRCPRRYTSIWNKERSGTPSGFPPIR